MKTTARALPMLLAFTATAALAVPPPVVPYLQSRMQSLSQQLQVLQSHIADQQQKQKTTLLQAQKQARQLIALSRWPTALATLTAARQGHITAPQLLAHMRSQTAQQLAQRQKQLQTLLQMRQDAAQKQQQIQALQAQIAAKGNKLTTEDKIALYAAATSADQLATAIQSALTPSLTAVGTPQATQADELPPLRPTKPEPAQPAAQKGKMPVAAKPRATTTGLLFLPPAAAPVTAAVAGTVLYAGPFRQFGGLIIIETAPHTQHIYAGLGTLTVMAGQPVKTGQNIGALPSKDPVHLYFEVRKNGQSLPAPKVLSLISAN